MSVGGFHVSTLSQSEVVSTITELGCTYEGVRTAFALHVGGLAYAGDSEVTQAYNVADIIYADGIAVVAAGFLIHGRYAQRSATTDIGVSILRRMAARLHRSVRVALIGGESGLAESAAKSLESTADVEVVCVSDGYASDWDERIAQLSRQSPDVVFVGMGAPKEMLWLFEKRDSLPGALYVTCGGWFNFLAGRERRAPRVLQRLGFEWVYRLLQDPRGKSRRYVVGIWHTLRVVVLGWRAKRRPSQ